MSDTEVERRVSRESPRVFLPGGEAPVNLKEVFDALFRPGTRGAAPFAEGTGEPPGGASRGEKKRLVRFLAGGLSLFVLFPFFFSCSVFPAGGGRGGNSLEAVLAGGGDSRNFTLISYNLQNLCDDVTQGGEYPEFVPGEGSRSWNSEAYGERLGNFTKVLAALAKLKGGNYPLFCLFQEVENDEVIRALKKRIVDSGGPGYVFADVLDGDAGPARLGVLSRVEPVYQRSHRVSAAGKTSRSVWELWFPVDAATAAGLSSQANSGGEGAKDGRSRELPEVPRKGRFLVLFVNHWKSKLGNQEEGSLLRRGAAEILRKRLLELSSLGAETAAIAAGDFNEELSALHEARSALRYLPPEKAVESFVSSQDFYLGVLSSPQKQDRWPPEVLLDPWGLRSEASAPGSYRYRKAWEKIDHLLLSRAFFDGRGIEFAAFEAPLLPAFVDSGGNPRTYLGPTKGGYSDHLPLLGEFVLLKDDR